MGYCITAPLKSERARDEMWAFLQEHYRGWTQIEPPEEELQPLPVAPEGGVWAQAVATPQGPWDPDYDWSLYLHRDLVYDSGKNRIGFSYSTSHGPVGDYAFAIVRWMALRAGRIRPFKKKYNIHESVPYIVYDGNEAWPVLRDDEWADRVPNNARWCLTKPNGFQPVRREWIPSDPETVERKVFIHSVPSKEAVLDVLRAQKLPEDWITEFGSELDNLPAELEATEPVWVRRIHSEFQKIGCKVTLEEGPFILDGWRKAAADAIEHAYQARERAIDAELTRLSDLWDAYISQGNRSTSV